MFEKFLKNMFLDANGRLVIAQMPNPPILLACLFILLGILPGLNNILTSLFSALAHGFVFVWAYLEIVSGVNYFRRFLGLIVLISVLISSV